MGWELYGRIMDDTDASATTNIFQTFDPGENSLLKYIRSRFIFFNDPSFTSIHLKLYAYDTVAEQPTVLLATSDSRTKTEIVNAGLSDAYGTFETYFEFDPNVPLQSGVQYAVVPNGVWTGFTGTSYLAWAKSYPLSPYRVDTKEDIVVGDYDIRPITAKF